MVRSWAVWSCCGIISLASQALLSHAAQAAAEVKFDRDFLAGIVEKLPPAPFKKDGSYRGKLHAYRLQAIDARARRLLVACQVEGEFRAPSLVRKTSASATPALDGWRSFRFEVQAAVNIEAGLDSVPRFKVEIKEIKRRELEGFGGALAKILGRSFDEMVTQIAQGKASSMNDKLNAEIHKRVNAVKDFGAFCGIDYYPTSLVLHFDLTRWKSDGIVGYVFPAERPGTAPLYRWIHVRRPDHVYTLNKFEPDRRLYRSEGISCYVFPTAQPDTVPLYRWHTLRDHFYTTAPDSEQAFRYGYRPEGVACHVYREQKPGTVPLYRFIDPRTRLHFYTTHPHAEFAK
jgi:hypothetical protein